MIRVLLVSSDDALADGLRAAIGDAFARTAPPSLAGGVPALLGPYTGDARPDLVVLDAAGGDSDALGAASALGSAGIAVVLVTPEPHRLAIEALRAGVRDVVAPTAGPAELRSALDRAVAVRPTGAPTAMPEEPTEHGRLVAVASPKGGVGKTTVATNLAVGLAKRFPNQVVLVDLDVHFGDVASALNLAPEYSLPDIAKGSISRDTIAVKSYLTSHETGLLVVPGSDSPAAADAVTADDAGALLAMLRGQFAFVVVDTAPGLSEHTLAVLDHADTLVLVTSLDVPGVRGLRKELDTLSQLRIVPGQKFVVLNFNDASRGLSVADVEATIRSTVDVVLPQSNAVPLSVNQGVPLLQSAGRDPVTRQLDRLVDLVAPPAEPAPRRGLFGRRST